MNRWGNRFIREDFWVRRVMRRGNIFAIFASMVLRCAREQPRAMQTWSALRSVWRARRRELVRTRKRNAALFISELAASLGVRGQA